MAKSREFLMVWDSTMANPNGDMLRENSPRQDESTGELEVSDVRIKRFIRDYWIGQDKNVLVMSEEVNGKVLTNAQRIKNIQTFCGKKDAEFFTYLLENYIDVRLFGAVITDPKKNYTGSLQITWSKSIHSAEIKFMQGNAAYASSEGKSQASIWSKYISPYALFKTYAVYNDMTAQIQNISVSEEDIDSFVDAWIMGMKTYRSTSKNQMPRMLIEIIYNNNRLNGELDILDFNYDVDDKDLRDISQVSIDFSKLKRFINDKKDIISDVKIYKDSKLECPTDIPKSRIITK